LSLVPCPSSYRYMEGYLAWKSVIGFFSLQLPRYDSVIEDLSPSKERERAFAIRRDSSRGLDGAGALTGSRVIGADRGGEGQSAAFPAIGRSVFWHAKRCCAKTFENGSSSGISDLAHLIVEGVRRALPFWADSPDTSVAVNYGTLVSGFYWFAASRAPVPA
jgi:hypothetical protein